MSGHENRGRGKGWSRPKARAGAGQVKGRAGQGRAGQGRAGQGRAGQGRAGHGRVGNSSTSTRQDPHHSVGQGILLVQQDSDEEAVGARVCHVSNAQQGCS